MSIRVLLVDDHPVVRAGLRAVLDAEPGVDVVAEAATGEEAVAVAAREAPDVLLCDLRLGPGMDGVGVTTAVRRLDPAPAVVILTTYDRDAEIIAAIEAGAAGYLLKDVGTDVIVAALADAVAGRTVLDPTLVTRVVRGMAAPKVQLTERELEVLRALDAGGSNRDIARALVISEATVKTHLVHVFTKLGVDSRTRALAAARDLGLLEG